MKIDFFIRKGKSALFISEVRDALKFNEDKNETTNVSEYSIQFELPSKTFRLPDSFHDFPTIISSDSAPNEAFFWREIFPQNNHPVWLPFTFLLDIFTSD